MWQLGMLIYLTLFLALLYVLVKTAPIGYEDNEGFHFSNKKQRGVNFGRTK